MTETERLDTLLAVLEEGPKTTGELAGWLSWAFSARWLNELARAGVVVNLSPPGEEWQLRVWGLPGHSLPTPLPQPKRAAPRPPAWNAPLVGAAVRKEPAVDYEPVPLPESSPFLGSSLSGASAPRPTWFGKGNRGEA